MTSRRSRCDSHAFEAEIADQVRRGLPAWPRSAGKPRSPAELQWFHDIVSARPFPAWSQLELQQAVVLARTFITIDTLDARIHREGELVENARGDLVLHPAFRLLERFTTQMCRLLRFLRLDLASRVRARNAAAREFERAARRDQAIREDLADVIWKDKDSLLALPVGEQRDAGVRASRAKRKRKSR